jgi:carbon monoxide dehydrogenase subunit G
VPIINKDILINAPLEDIYGYVSKPSNLQQIWPSLIELKNKKTPLSIGFSYRWMYKMSGMFFTGTGECTNIMPNHRYTVKNSGSINSLITWTFLMKGDKTRVTFTNDYKIPEALLARVPESIINKMNEKETELILENLRAKFETKEAHEYAISG